VIIATPEPHVISSGRARAYRGGVERRDRPRRPWIAALLALLAPGLGHAYAGRIVPALVICAAGLALGAATLAAFRASFRAFVATSVAALAFYVGQALLAARQARAAVDEPRAWYARPFGLALLLVAALAASAALNAAERSPRALYTPTGSMTPTLRVGDYVLVDPGAPIERGAIVLHQPVPRSHGRQMVKRVVAVGGDLVELRDGRLFLGGVLAAGEATPGRCTYEEKIEGGAWREEPCVDFVETVGTRAYHVHCTPGRPCGDFPLLIVPPGHVFVLGDHRDHSLDSRSYGPIPRSLVAGRVSYVIFSKGPSGVRWERIGDDVR
jgi:signal peptidase I